MNYRNYTITRVTYQGTLVYLITPPVGPAWSDLAATLRTAKRWIDVTLRCGG